MIENDAPKNVFKENWLKVDKVCEHCGQVTERQRGLTKQNLKRLMTIKFNMNEVIITLIIILVLISAYAYKVETQICRDYVKQEQNSFINITPSIFTRLCNNNSCNLTITNVTR
jgi:hypothetical protein